MEIYSGVKTIKARPMTNGQFFDYVDISADAPKFNDPGYLIGYPDIEGNFDGDLEAGCHYVSWSPADVFENSYRLGGIQKASDGYHSFEELYWYRMLYNAMLFNQWARWAEFDVHKSWRHHDGELCFEGNWFVVVATLPTGQISNHYPKKDWEMFKIPVRPTAAEWDGHTPEEARNRMVKFLSIKDNVYEEESFICQHCQKVITEEDQNVIVQASTGLVFCSQSCIDSI